jgi:tetratricopeptide (TPR) repeat protein
MLNANGSFIKLVIEPVIVTVVIAVIAFAFAIVALGQDDDPASDAVALFNKGQDAHEKGDLTTAIQNYEKALKLIPEFPEAEVQRGSAYLSLEKLDEAEAAFRRAVILREDWSLALANLGSVLVRKGNFTEAEKLLTKAIDLDEQNFPAYAAMTELRLQTKADTKVLSVLLARLSLITLKANPTASVWASRAALELATGDLKSAKLSAARALDVDPRSQFALSTSAEIALRESDPAAADSFVRRLEALTPRSEPVRVLRARVLAAEGKPDEAIASLNAITTPSAPTIDIRNQLVAANSLNPSDIEKQLAADPASPVLLARLCSAYRTSDPARSLDFCRRASEAAPQNVEPVIGYAAALVQAKRFDDAVTVLRRLLAVAPENSTVRANLATALFQLKRYAEAKTEFQWLTRYRPDHPTAYYFLGIVHDQLQEFADAAANYQQFLRLADRESSKLEIDKINLRLPIIHNLIKEGKGKKRG